MSPGQCTIYSDLHGIMIAKVNKFINFTYLDVIHTNINKKGFICMYIKAC